MENLYKLDRLDYFQGRSGPLLLIIMDGIGIGKKDDGNAVNLAKTKNLVRFERKCRAKNLYAELKAHGSAVGLPTDKDMGNSEVGHNAMGSGQIFPQGAILVNKAIHTKKLFETEIWKKITGKIIKTKNTIHLIGLLSDGNVHSHINQLFGILDGLAESGVNNVRVHTLLDGRDVPGKSALKYINSLENKLKNINTTLENKDYNYLIASGGGRMYVTMDRYESDWKVVKRGWDAHVLGVIEKEDLIKGYKGYFKTAENAVVEGRRCFPEKNDQTMPPFVIVDEKNVPVGRIVDGDAVINFNFRGDRAIQISKAFENEDFSNFERKNPPNIDYMGLLEYDGDKHIPKQYLVHPPNIKNVLSDYLCAQDISQFAIAETHKFGHVTYFWNGNKTGYICPDKEEYVEIKSEPTEMISKHPEMKAYEVCDRTIKALKNGKYKFVRVNLANGDMVGHTGILNATITAVETVDECVGKLTDTVIDLGGITIITADHGNADEMKLKNGKPKTSHTLNPVVFLIVDKNWIGEYEINPEIPDPGLSNIASTVLNLLGYEIPKHYRDSLIRFK
ncbi:MAG: 2,3-bisphosphoglycerate-independent phosphoglycerate mutase [Promethearchaeota archaeon]